MNIYKQGFKPIQPTAPVVPTVQEEVVSDVVHQELSPRVRQSVVNNVIRTRGTLTTKLEPLFLHTPLQRQYLEATPRNKNLPKDVTLQGPDYDFREINKVLGVDGFAARAMRTLISATLKGEQGIGFKFESKNNSAKQYVLNRLEELTFAVEGTGSPNKLMRKLVHSFVTKSNVLLIIHRRPKSKSTKAYKWKGWQHNEMQAIEAVDPAMVDIARSSKTRRVVGFRLRTGATDEVISLSDSYLLKWEDMRQDNLFAQPIITPVLDDILVLRRIEEIHELALGKATFPMIHVAIGEANRDARVFGVGEVDNEIGRTKDALEGQAPEGFLVTPHYYKLEVIQPKSIADFLPYMTYYRDRIITGLNMDGPSMGIGDTSNRNTASTMTQQLIEKVRDIRTAIAEEINTTIIREILVEGGFSPVGDSSVSMVWEDPDPTETRAKENHYLAQYVQGGITLTELREKLGRRKLTPAEEKDLIYNRAEQAKMNSTVTQPTNQHGTLATKPKSGSTKDAIKIITHNKFQEAKDSYFKLGNAKEALEKKFTDLNNLLSPYLKLEQVEIVTDQVEKTKNNLIKNIREATKKHEIVRQFDISYMALLNTLDNLGME
jgi:hypothetical protein